MTATDPPRGEPRVMVFLTSAALRVEDAVAAVSDPECGGIGSFAGVVRNHHDGQAVEGLDYEAWEEQAEKALAEVARHVLDEFRGVRAVYAAHRVGELSIGDISVVVAASAPHRHEAIAAAQALIDRLKERVPIWKRERLVDGHVRWPGSETDASDHPDRAADARSAPPPEG